LNQLPAPPRQQTWSQRLLAPGRWLAENVGQRLSAVPTPVWAVPLGLLVAALPFLTNSYWLRVANFLGIYILLGLSLDLMVGHTGIFNLGHAAFIAVGAYTAAILSSTYGLPFWITLPAAALAAALAGILVARPIIHLRGDYLMIVTIGFGEIVRIALVQNVFGMTGGPNGILGIQRPAFFGFTVRTMTHYYYLIGLFVLLTIIFLQRLVHSRIGRALHYVREDQIAAEAMGIDTHRVKLLAFALGAGLGGVGGALYAHMLTIIAPETFSLMQSVIVFSIVVLGGPGSIPGIIVGSIGMIVLPEIFREFAEYRMLVFGAAMVAMMVFRPAGLWPSRAWQLKSGREEVEPEPVASEAATD